MTKDRNQPFWGLTPEFGRANARLVLSDEKEEKHYLTETFLQGFGKLIKVHTNFTKDAEVTHEQLLFLTDQNRPGAILNCDYYDLQNFSGKYYHTGFKVGRKLEYPLHEELFGDIKSYLSRKKQNPLQNNLLYNSVEQWIEKKGQYAFSVNGVFTEVYSPSPWEDHLLCSVGLMTPDYDEDEDKAKDTPARMTILRPKVYDMLTNMLKVSNKHIEEVTSNFSYE